MNLDPPKSAASPLMWFAVLGAPLAWAVEFAIGYWVTQTGCSVPGQRWNVGIDVWGIVLMSIALTVAAAAGLIAVTMFRGTRDAEMEGSPPAGRVHFLAAIGITVTVLFTFVIVMTGVGIVILPDCRQS